MADRLVDVTGLHQDFGERSPLAGPVAEGSGDVVEHNGSELYRDSTVTRHAAQIRSPT
ncbi:MAG: hypothetical protein ACRDSL_22470 [Pseudonocardiaceae bacterium]